MPELGRDQIHIFVQQRQQANQSPASLPARHEQRRAVAAAVPHLRCAAHRRVPARPYERSAAGLGGNDHNASGAKDGLAPQRLAANERYGSVFEPAFTNYEFRKS